MNAYSLIPAPATAGALEPFGRHLSLRSGVVSTDVVSTEGDGWSDRRSLNAIIDTPGSLGHTIGAATPFRVSGMERHPHTEEALFCAGAPVVVAVADTAADRPAAADVRAFLLEPGDVIVLNRGIWHTACYGVGTPTPYYWLATADDSIVDEWVEPHGGSVHVETPGARS